MEKSDRGGGMGCNRRSVKEKKDKGEWRIRENMKDKLDSEKNDID
jgi:hypothetical protein